MVDTETENDVDVATFVNGPNAGQISEGEFVSGVVYTYDDGEYMCDVSVDGNFILYQNKDTAYELLTTMVPSIYF